ncbi:tetratricopeptide repeat protein [Herminiimonas sp. CN]|uniref:tetratricopeptide repeat protein n=1 Tax=Herminiimonas sp. CN TaxID=1349818 RepID=UPI0004741641|nr:SEL1-like repeat protein [Herminiimonas sp. CN]
MATREELALIRGARAGEVAAQLALGTRYLFGGGGLPQSLPTALHWLERAARQDESAAWMLIGSHVPVETVRLAAKPLSYLPWYEKAFDAGVLPAGLVFASLVLESASAPQPALRDKALQALQAAAQAGIADAQWLLARQAGLGAAAPESAPALAGADQTPLAWAGRAADGGVAQAQQALAEHAWAESDWGGFLHRALPLARALVDGVALIAEADAPEVLKAQAQRLAASEVRLLSRAGQALSCTEHADAALMQRCWELAAYAGDREAQLALGLWLARIDSDGARAAMAPGSAHYRKAIGWLTRAGEQGSAEAWFALSRVYLKAEFSQRSLADARRYLEHAAEMGHCAAQLECGAAAWRSRREEVSNDVRAAYWLQKAAAQGSREALLLLAKVAAPAAPTAWAVAAQQHVTREMRAAQPFLAARIELAALFGLSRAEALLIDLNLADCGHCLQVDIRAQNARSKRRLILLQTGEELQALHRIKRIFEDVDCGPTGPEGNYRQRQYRLKALLADTE